MFVGVMVTMEIHVHMTSVCRCDGYNGNIRAVHMSSVCRCDGYNGNTRAHDKCL